MSADDVQEDAKKKKPGNSACSKLKELIGENPDNEGLRKAFVNLCRGPTR